MLAVLGACATREPLKTVSDTCLNLRALTYAELPEGATDDPGNQADTPQTVREIETHNAKYDAVCPQSPVSSQSEE